MWGPELAMLTVYGLSWRNLGENSSSNGSSQMESPPEPVPVAANKAAKQVFVGYAPAGTWLKSIKTTGA